MPEAQHDPNDIAPDTYLERETGDDPEWSIIWLHGLGADGHDFEPLVPELGLPDRPAIRFIFPHAPVRPITINGGMQMRGWYDITGMAFDRDEDRAGIEQSAAIVQRFIERENARGIAHDHIILAGFSQGGAVSLFAGLRMATPLAAIIALSTYLPLAPEIESAGHPASREVPIFMAHGDHDPVIPIELAARSRDILQSLGHSVEWHSYPMPHSVSAAEISAITTFIGQVVTEYR